jgi:hypothetical protein
MKLRIIDYIIIALLFATIFTGIVCVVKLRADFQITQAFNQLNANTMSIQNIAQEIQKLQGDKK